MSDKNYLHCDEADGEITQALEYESQSLCDIVFNPSIEEVNVESRIHGSSFSEMTQLTQELPPLSLDFISTQDFASNVKSLLQEQDKKSHYNGETSSVAGRAQGSLQIESRTNLLRDKVHGEMTQLTQELPPLSLGFISTQDFASNVKSLLQEQDKKSHYNGETSSVAGRAQGSLQIESRTNLLRDNVHGEMTQLTQGLPPLSLGFISTQDFISDAKSLPPITIHMLKQKKPIILDKSSHCNREISPAAERMQECLQNESQSLCDVYNPSTDEAKLEPRIRSSTISEMTQLTQDLPPLSLNFISTQEFISDVKSAPQTIKQNQVVRQDKNSHCKGSAVERAQKCLQDESQSLCDVEYNPGSEEVGIVRRTQCSSISEMTQLTQDMPPLSLDFVATQDFASDLKSLLQTQDMNSPCNGKISSAMEKAQESKSKSLCDSVLSEMTQLTQDMPPLSLDFVATQDFASDSKSLLKGQDNNSDCIAETSSAEERPQKCLQEESQSLCDVEYNPGSEEVGIVRRTQCSSISEMTQLTQDMPPLSLAFIATQDFIPTAKSSSQIIPPNGTQSFDQNSHCNVKNALVFEKDSVSDASQSLCDVYNSTQLTQPISPLSLDFVSTQEFSSDLNHKRLCVPSCLKGSIFSRLSQSSLEDENGSKLISSLVSENTCVQQPVGLISDDCDSSIFMNETQVPDLVGKLTSPAIDKVSIISHTESSASPFRRPISRAKKRSIGRNHKLRASPSEIGERVLDRQHFTELAITNSENPAIFLQETQVCTSSGNLSSEFMKATQLPFQDSYDEIFLKSTQVCKGDGLQKTDALFLEETQVPMCNEESLQKNDTLFSEETQVPMCNEESLQKNDTLFSEETQVPMCNGEGLQKNDTLFLEETQVPILPKLKNDCYKEPPFLGNRSTKRLVNEDKIFNESTQISTHSHLNLSGVFFEETQLPCSLKRSEETSSESIDKQIYPETCGKNEPDNSSKNRVNTFVQSSKRIGSLAEGSMDESVFLNDTQIISSKPVLISLLPTLKSAKVDEVVNTTDKEDTENRSVFFKEPCHDLEATTHMPNSNLSATCKDDQIASNTVYVIESDSDVDEFILSSDFEATQSYDYDMFDSSKDRGKATDKTDEECQVQLYVEPSVAECRVLLVSSPDLTTSLVEEELVAENSSIPESTCVINNHQVHAPSLPRLVVTLSRLPAEGNRRKRNKNNEQPSAVMRPKRTRKPTWKIQCKENIADDSIRTRESSVDRLSHTLPIPSTSTSNILTRFQKRAQSMPISSQNGDTDVATHTRTALKRSLVQLPSSSENELVRPLRLSRSRIINSEESACENRPSTSKKRSSARCRSKRKKRVNIIRSDDDDS